MTINVAQVTRQRAYYRLLAALTVLEAMIAAMFPDAEQTAPPVAAMGIWSRTMSAVQTASS